MAERLSVMGMRVFILSEYVKVKRIPDAIIYGASGLIALEVETERRWKPGHASTEERLSRSNALCSFFEKTKVVFPNVGDSLSETGPALLNHVTS